MKNKILICLLVVMMLFVAGCGKKPAEINTPTNTDSNTNTVNDNTNNNTQIPSDSLPILEIQQQYKEDLPLGLENNYLKVNGNDIVVRVQTSGSSEQQANGPYFIYYNMYVGNDALGLKCVRDAIYHLEGYGVTMLKEFNEEEYAGVNY